MVQVLLDVLAPVFAVVAVGFFLARRLGLEPAPLASLSYWVLGPAFIYAVLAPAELGASVVGKIVGATVITMVVIGVVAAITMKVLGVEFSKLAAAVLTSIHGNVGNFGLAISVFAFGPEALPIASIVMVTTNTLGIITGVGLATSRDRSIFRAIVTGLATPMAIAVVPALIANLTNTSLPLWLDRPVSLLADAMIPVMLLTLGVQMAGMGGRVISKLTAVPITLKLVLAPLVAAVVVSLLDLGADVADVVIVQAAMPAAVFTSLVALEHDLEPDFVTAVVMVGTIASALTLPVVLTLL